MLTCCCCRLPRRSWISNCVFIKKPQSNKCCPCGTNNSFNYFHMSILKSPPFPSRERKYFWIVAKREYFELSLKGNTSALLTKRSFLKGCQNGVFLNCFRKVVFLNCYRKGVFLVRNARVTWVTTLTKSPPFPSLEVKCKNVEYFCYKNHFSKKKSKFSTVKSHFPWILGNKSQGTGKQIAWHCSHFRKISWHEFLCDWA